MYLWTGFAIWQATYPFSSYMLFGKLDFAAFAASTPCQQHKSKQSERVSLTSFAIARSEHENKVKLLGVELKDGGDCE